MQFSLLTLLIIMALVCVFCASLNVPVYFTVPIYCCLAWLTPAYWVIGTIYAQGARRAFYIGGLTSTVAPYIVLTFMCVVFIVDGPWRWGRNSSWDNTILTNLTAAFFLFMPVLATFLGAWLGYGVFYLVQPPTSPSQSVTKLDIVAGGIQSMNVSNERSL